MKFSVILSLVTCVLAAAPGPKKKPPVDPEALVRSINRGNLNRHALALTQHAKLSNGTRAFGTKAHNATVNYIKKTLDATGAYDVEIQTFSYLFSEGSAVITTDSELLPAPESEWFTYGPAGEVSGTLVVVNELGCTAEDFPGEVAGQIALIQRGSCEFGLKVALAGAAGAAGAIIYNNADGPIGGGTLGSPSRDVGPYVPAGSISGVDGATLISAIANGPVEATIAVDAINEDRFTSNVLATSKVGDKKNIVFSGGHTDSVPAGPGINDNGSGSMGILEIAVQLAKYSVKNAVKFGFWTAEEYGLVGAEHYVASLTEAEIADIALYLNFDMIASPNVAYFIYDGDGSAFNITGPAGSDHIEKSFENYFKSVGVQSAPTAFSGRSDYGPFLDVNIPSGGLFTGAEGIKTEQEAQWWGGQAGEAYDPNYHKAGDTIENLDFKAWVVNTQAAAKVIAQYATSLEGIDRTAPRRKFVKRDLTHWEKRHSACGHKMHVE